MKHKNVFKRVFTLVLALVTILSVGYKPLPAYAYEVSADVRSIVNVPTDLSGKTLILHTNDVHGAIDGYAKAALLSMNFKLEVQR